MALSPSERSDYEQELTETRKQIQDLDFRIRQDTRIRGQLAGYVEALEADLGLDALTGVTVSYGDPEPSPNFEYLSVDGAYVFFLSTTGWRFRGGDYGFSYSFDEIPKSVFPLSQRVMQ